MRKTNPVPKQMIARSPLVFSLAILLILSVSACVKPSTAPTSGPPTATETILPPSPTPTETLIPTPTETATPAFSIFGTWVPDEDTATALINQPPPGEFCYPNAYWHPIPEIIISESADPAIVIVEGLQEHVRTQELAFDVTNQRIEDTQDIPNINQSLVLVLQLEADGRLYHQEIHLLGGEVYCSIALYYVSAGD